MPFHEQSFLLNVRALTGSTSPSMSLLPLQSLHLKSFFRIWVTDLLVLLVLLRITFRFFFIFIPGNSRTKLGGPAARPINSWLTALTAQMNGLSLKAGEGNRAASCGQGFGHAANASGFSSPRSNFTGSSRSTGWQSKSQAKCQSECQSQEQLFEEKTDCTAGNLKQTTVQTGTSRTVVDSIGLPETLELGSGVMP